MATNDDNDDEDDAVADAVPHDKWTIVGGAGRCSFCIKAGVDCKINVGAIEAWRDGVSKGVRYKRHPDGVNCRYCTEKRKKPCPLPATEKMRAVLVEKTAAEVKTKGESSLGVATRGGGSRSRGGSSAPSATSSGKRKRLAVEVELPAKKKPRGVLPLASTSTAVASGSGSVPWASLQKLVELSERRWEESSKAAAAKERELAATLAEVARGLKTQNTILERIERLLGGRKEDDEEDEEEEEEDEDGGEVGNEPMEVPILDMTSAEVRGVEKEIGGSKKGKEKEDV